MDQFLKSSTGFILFVLLLAGCETGFENEISDPPPIISQFSITPNEVDFNSKTDQIFDTTLTINLSGQVKQISENTQTYFSVSDIQNNEIIEEGNLTLISESEKKGHFDQDLSISISTSTISNFLVLVTATNESGNGPYAQSVLRINGISNSPPEIIDVNNPTEYIIPQTDTENVRFTAKVTDKDGKNNIEGVFLRLFSRTTGEAGSSPFELFDDGQSLGDQFADDSVYTLTFPVSPENQPDTYDIHYYATDRGGLVSDTVKTTFTLVE